MFISYLAAPLMIISGLPQIIRLIKTKDSSNISISMFYLTLLAVFLLFIEALRIHNNILIIADFCSIVMLTINIVLIKKYEKQ